MSTLAEIQKAINHLSGAEKRALSLWLKSQAEAEVSSADEQQIIASLDRAMGQIEAGKGVPIEEVRRLVD